MKLIEIRDVRAGYGGGDVLKGVSLSFVEGEMTAIIGPNGAGKSTLLKTVCGALNPSSGEALFRGRPICSIGEAALARELAVVHQLMENIPPFSVYEFVRLGRFPYRAFWRLDSPGDDARIEEALAAVGAGHLRTRTITGLSGGERQLVYLARALAQSERVIILDEPVSHLDIRHAVRVMDVLHELNTAGTTIITVLHDINLASDYCQRIVALRDGSVFADGPPGEVIRYQVMEPLFDTVCVVFENPITKKPYTFPVPRHAKS
ncbi:MAG TPA: ABC transporter ATP-binding protein [Spirochaetota bacterium]|nr:ABC transporter ATP-binding protein [Spirochaetota bacterium]